MEFKDYVHVNCGTIPSMTIRSCKPVARISICDALHFNIMEHMNWNPPTEEQVKNLKEMFCIDVEIFEKGDGSE